MTRPLIIYHGGCPDGFTAAWVAAKRFGSNAEFLPAKYGDPPPACNGRTVFVLDFSYPRDVLARMFGECGGDLVVLDHHKTAAADLEGLPFCTFDMNRSGARLAWDHFFGPEHPPLLVRYVEDRDLWRWEMNQSRAVNAAIASYPMIFMTWDLLDGRLQEIDGADGLVDEGAAILRYQEQQVARICENAGVITIDDHKALAANTPVLQSEVAGRLAEGRPFGIAWYRDKVGVLRVSLRSRAGGVDVSEIAKRRGGGGHRNAAGFECREGDIALTRPPGETKGEE